MTPERMLLKFLSTPRDSANLFQVIATTILPKHWWQAHIGGSQGAVTAPFKQLS